jgi:hypothetical protein
LGGEHCLLLCHRISSQLSAVSSQQNLFASGYFRSPLYFRLIKAAT